jgi:hypothetical protein
VPRRQGGTRALFKALLKTRRDLQSYSMLESPVGSGASDSWCMIIICDPSYSLTFVQPSIQIRTVKVIKEFTAGMDDRIESAIQRALQNHSFLQASPHTPGLTHTPRTPSVLRPSSRRFAKPLEEIISVQDDKDRELDLNDLDQQIDHTLQSGNDVMMFKFLQVPREDILEAIKSMQRYLEKQRQQGAKDPPNVHTHDSRTILGCEFIEAGIDTLRRMSKSNNTLPSWTITRFILSFIKSLELILNLDSRSTVALKLELALFPMSMKARGVVKLLRSRFYATSTRVAFSFERLRFGRISATRMSLSFTVRVVPVEILPGFLLVHLQNTATLRITSDISVWEGNNEDLGSCPLFHPLRRIHWKNCAEIVLGRLGRTTLTVSCWR